MPYLLAFRPPIAHEASQRYSPPFEQVSQSLWHEPLVHSCDRVAVLETSGAFCVWRDLARCGLCDLTLEFTGTAQLFAQFQWNHGLDLGQTLVT
jgi:hypothetical protein